MSIRIPVFAGPRCIEYAGPERLVRLLAAPNAIPIIQRKTRAVVRVELLAYGDDSRLPSVGGNDQTFTYRSEDERNPRRVWAFKRLFLTEDAAGGPG
jgi:hypothetical protein